MQFWLGCGPICLVNAKHLMLKIHCPTVFKITSLLKCVRYINILLGKQTPRVVIYFNICVAQVRRPLPNKRFDTFLTEFRNMLSFIDGRITDTAIATITERPQTTKRLITRNDELIKSLSIHGVGGNVCSQHFIYY